jgi:hypothetical protein
LIGGVLPEYQILKYAIQYSKQVGEIFFLDQQKDPVEFSQSSPTDFFPAVCLSAINSYSDISDSNYPDLVPHLRGRKLTYLAGLSGEKSQFDVESYDVTSNVATLTFADQPTENDVLAALAEDSLVNGGFSNWRSIELPSAIGGITADVYAITDVDEINRTVKFSVGIADESGSVTAVAEFPEHKVAGSTTTARLFEVKGRSLVAANDSDGEVISGLRRRDRMQGHWHDFYNNTSIRQSGTSDATDSEDADTPAGDGYVREPVSDGTNGTPRTGSTTEPRALGVHVYMWAGRYTA